MKKLITILVGLAVAAAMSTAAFAQAAGPTGGGVQSGGGPLQGKKGGGGNAGPIGPKIIKELGLDREQMLKVKDLVVSFKQKRDQLAPQGTKPNPKALAPLRKQFIEDFTNILTPEQKEKFKTLMSEKRKGAGKGVLGTGAAGTGTTGTGTGTTGTGTTGSGKTGGGQ